MSAGLSCSLLLLGCATPPAAAPVVALPAVPAGDAACGQWFAALDGVVAATGTGDGQYAPVPGFVALRASRFLVAVRPDTNSDEFYVWAERLRRLDAEARAIEIGNAGLPVPQAAIERCGRTLLAGYLAAPAQREALARAVRVPDDYSTFARVMGLYPLTSAPFSVGVHRLHEQTRERFATAAPAITARRYVAPAANRLASDEVAALLAASADNALGIPEPARAELALLFATFAPTLVVEGDAEHDRIGAPMLGRDGARIDTRKARIYTRSAHTRFAGETLLQLVYVAWFTERPASGALDLLAGRLDGIVWRVTLARDGRPLLYDVMHACGCYHMAFPGPRLRARETGPRWQEPLLVPGAAPDAGTGLVVTLQSGTHYVASVSAPERFADAIVYQLADYDELRRLPLPAGGTRSLFRPDGIVAGSERGERWLFWPMGVSEPGAMRQSGRHAVAFVGRRHFDDAGLVGAWFEAAP